MAGRKQYDSQTTIRAINRVDSEMISVIPGGKWSANTGGGMAQFDYIPEAGKIIKVEGLAFNFNRASQKGAASGYIQIDVSKKILSDGSEVGICTMKANFDKYLEFRRNGSKTDDATTYAEPTYKKPDSYSDILLILGNMTFDENTSLTVKVFNFTNVNLVDLPCYFNAAINKTDIS